MRSNIIIFEGLVNSFSCHYCFVALVVVNYPQLLRHDGENVKKLDKNDRVANRAMNYASLFCLGLMVLSVLAADVSVSEVERSWPDGADEYLIISVYDMTMADSCGDSIDIAPELACAVVES